MPRTDRTRPCISHKALWRASHVWGESSTSLLSQCRIFLTVWHSEKVPRDLFLWRNTPCLCVDLQKSLYLQTHAELICHNQEILPRQISWLGSHHPYLLCQPFPLGEWLCFLVYIPVSLGMQCILWELYWCMNYYSQEKVETQARCCVPKIFESISNLSSLM